MAAMNPRATLPGAKKRETEVRTVPTSEPRLGGAVVLNSPGAALEVSAGTEVNKPIRAAKEPLPEASTVDLQQRLEIKQPVYTPTAPPLPLAAELAQVVVSFDSGAFGNPGTIPPDTHGAPGPDSVMTTLNNRVWWHDRNGTPLTDVTLDVFWNVFGEDIDTFDPKLFNDELTGRFIFVVCGNAQLPSSSLLVAASRDGDPQGDWEFGRITVDTDAMGDVWIDYPSVGFTEDKITICVNLFALANNSFEGVAIFVIDKQAFLNSPHNFVFDQFVVTDQGGTLCPAIVADPGTSDQYLVSNWTGNFQGKGYLALYRIAGSVAGGTTEFARVGFLEVSRTWTFGFPGDQAPQQGTSAKIDAGDARMQWVVQRHGKLHLAHTVFLPDTAPTRCAIQWVEVDLDDTPAVTESALIGGSPDNFYYAYPSLAVNASGDTLIGMAAFADSIFASGAFAFRPAGGTFGAPVIYAPGQSSYRLTFGGSRNRWGDYSSTHVDPADTNNFWTIQEYAGPQQDEWRTRWAHIVVSSGTGVS